MVWGAISLNGMFDLVVVNGRMNAQKYIDTILETAVKPYIEVTPDAVFQQDNAPVHTANKCKDWLKANGIQVLDWPPQSPDLSLIENLWNILKEEVGDLNNVNRNNMEQLIQIVTDAWQRIRTTRPNLMATLYGSMRRRMHQCRVKRGGATKY